MGAGGGYGVGGAGAQGELGYGKGKVWRGLNVGGSGGAGQAPCRSTGQVSNYGLVVESVCHLQRPAGQPQERAGSWATHCTVRGPFCNTSGLLILLTVSS